ncbi:MAG: polysaccharide deacetylase family protein [Puia sp.]
MKRKLLFFALAKIFQERKILLKRMVQEGHIIGNHSFSHHPLFDFFGSGKMLNDITAMNQLVKNITGLTPRFFRPPYGVTNPNLKKAVLLADLSPSDGRSVHMTPSLRTVNAC